MSVVGVWYSLFPCPRRFSDFVEHVCNWCGCLAVCCGLGLARKQMQRTIHALKAVADSSVRYDGVADLAASLSLPWLASWAADWVSVQHCFSLHANSVSCWTELLHTSSAKLHEENLVSLDQNDCSGSKHKLERVDHLYLKNIQCKQCINNTWAYKQQLSVVVKDHLPF